MKKLLTGCMLLTLCVSCGNGKNAQDPFAALTQQVDSMKPSCNQVPATTSKSLATFAGPLEADELFDDFIFNYTSDENLQKQRTSFPLPYNQDGNLTYINREAWQHDRLFTGQNFYTLLFDREQDMDIVGDTALTTVQVEWIFLHEQESKKYYFKRNRGMWMLDSISKHPIKGMDGNDFLSFYVHFVSDSLFQQKHIHTPLHFVTIDPDDEFSILETTLDLEQWYAFRPMMPTDWLSNICYGQRNEAYSSSKILKVNGIGNGYSNVFYFRKRKGDWELYKYEDTSI